VQCLDYQLHVADLERDALGRATRPAGSSSQRSGESQFAEEQVVTPLAIVNLYYVVEVSSNVV
jgi:hypothetical protein